MDRKFDKYELVEKIGAGGMAEVWLAKSRGAEGFEKQLVIKKILPQLATNPRFVDMFIAEARIAVGLNHPNIVQIYDFGRVGPDFFLAMEHVDGWDLGTVVGAAEAVGRALPVGDALYIGLEIARGLDYAHRRLDPWGQSIELVHRDMSPQNVLVSRDGGVKIVDFGIAKATTMAEESPQTVVGKFCYMSPEQASGEAVDQRSDLFSLGVVLFELLCGRPLFRRATREQILSLVRSAVVPDVASLNEAIPAEVERALYKLLARDPADRYQSARALQRDLARALGQMDELHDSYTLSEYLHALGPALFAAPAVPTTPGASARSTQRTQVSVSAERTRERELEPDALVRTPAAPSPIVGPIARTIVDEPSAPEPRSPPGGRVRKEAVLLVGQIAGFVELRSRVSQERWLQIFQEYTRVVDSIAFKADAVVHRVDEAGFAILLGIPVSSENDAKRSARISLDLHDAMAGINLSLETPLALSIGLAIADVVLDHLSGARRFAWSFFDDSHEFADRLARAAVAKETLLGGQIWRRIKRDYHCEKVEKLSDRAAAQAWRLDAPKSPRERVRQVRRAYNAFYGRELELRALRNAYREVLIESRAGMVAVIGEQGVGKSTLIEEFFCGLDPRDVRVVRGVANPSDQDLPLGGLAEPIAELLRLGPRDDLRAVRASLETRVGALFAEKEAGERGALNHAIGAVFGVRYAGSSFDELLGGERRRRIAAALSALLLRFARKKPFVLSIDDAQYLDPMTLEFARDLFDEPQSAPICLIAALPPSGFAAEPDRWARLLDARFARTVELGELGESETEALIRDTLRVHRVEGSGLVENIMRRSGGNPFYIKEVFEALRDRELLGAVGEPLEARIDLELDRWLPTSVEGLLSARLDRLELRLKEIVGRIALLWNPFSAEDAEAAAGRPVESELGELVAQGLLERLGDHRGPGAEEESESGEEVFRFRNTLARGTAARLLLADEARSAHARIADRLEASYDDPGPAGLALTARHLEGAGRIERAIDHYVRAADGAFEQFGAAESLRLCERALALADDAGSPRARKALALQETAYRELGRAREHLEVLHRMLALTARPGSDPDDRAAALLKLARYYYDQAGFRESLDAIEQARAWASEHDLADRIAQSSYHEACVRIDQGRHDEAVALIERAAAHFERSDSPLAATFLPMLHNFRGVALRRAGRNADALHAYDRALEVVADGDLLSRRFLLINRGVALLDIGRYAEALSSHAEALAEARRVGLRRDEASILINFGHTLAAIGAWERALDHVRRGLHLARRASASIALADGEIALGICYAGLGESVKAERALAEGLRMAESIPNIYLAVHAMLHAAELKLAAHDPRSVRVAAVQAEDSLERAERAAIRGAMVHALILLARVARALGLSDRELGYAERAKQMGDRGELYRRVQALYEYSVTLARRPSAAAEAAEAAAQARALLEERAALLEPELRRGYLAMPLHRAILEATSG